MAKFILRIFHFIREYPGILFSLFLILFLPALLYYNTFFVANSFQKNIDRNFQTQTVLIEKILAEFLGEKIENHEILQEKILKIAKENPEIKDLRILKKVGEEFEIVASQNLQEIGLRTKDPSFVLAFSQEQAIASLTAKNGERFWHAIQPLYHPKERKKIGLISMAFSLKEADFLITKAVFFSFGITILAILITLFLIFQHTRLFGYVELTKKLKELDKMKDNFIRMATHELQSPIVNIRGYLELLKEKLDPSLNQEQKELFKRVEICAKNLSDLIYDILEVARIEQGRLDLSPEKVNPKEQISQVVEELKMKAEKKGLYLKTKFALEPFYIKVNPKRLRQILFNLLDNALKYTFEGGVIIETQIDKKRKSSQIIISDTGIGISAQDQKKIFERFYRVKTKETAEIPGTGLGLWIAKQLTEKMGGKIFVESIKGRGTRFVLNFPLA